MAQNRRDYTRLEVVKIRVAREMFCLSMADLAAAAGVSVSTVKRIEDASYGTVAGSTWQIIREALETAGVTFLDEDPSGLGVRVRRSACVPAVEH